MSRITLEARNTGRPGAIRARNLADDGPLWRKVAEPENWSWGNHAWPGPVFADDFVAPPAGFGKSPRTRLRRPLLYHPLSYGAGEAAGPAASERQSRLPVLRGAFARPRQGHPGSRPDPPAWAGRRGPRAGGTGTGARAGGRRRRIIRRYRGQPDPGGVRGPYRGRWPDCSDKAPRPAPTRSP